MADYDKFLNCITVAELKQLSTDKSVRDNSKKQFTFQTSKETIVNNKERFFEAAHYSLPLDPPNVSHNWDALDDSLFGGLLGLKSPYVDIIWPFANDVAVVFLVEGVKFFKGVADSIRFYDDEDRSVMLRLFLVCSNEKSRSNLEAEFWFLK